MALYPNKKGDIPIIIIPNLEHLIIKKKKVQRFTWQGIDLTFDGINVNDSEQKREVLCPYGTDTIKAALSKDGIKERVKLIDSTILRLIGI